MSVPLPLPRFCGVPCLTISRRQAQRLKPILVLRSALYSSHAACCKLSIGKKLNTLHNIDGLNRSINNWMKHKSCWKYRFCTRSRFLNCLAANKGNAKESVHGKNGLISVWKFKARSITSDKGGSQSENIFTIPNVLSLARITLSPVIGYTILQSDYTIALALLGIAGVTDLLDGFIARNFKDQSTVFGSMLDPVADKVLMSVLTISLTCVSLLPVQLCALIIGRDVGLILAVAYLRYITLPAPLTISRYFDFNLPTVQMKPTQISKYNTGLQLGLVGLCLAAPVFGFVDHYWLHAYWYLVGTTTVISGLSYVANKDTFKVIKQTRQ